MQTQRAWISTRVLIGAFAAILSGCLTPEAQLRSGRSSQLDPEPVQNVDGPEPTPTPTDTVQPSPAPTSTPTPTPTPTVTWEPTPTPPQAGAGPNQPAGFTARFSNPMGTFPVQNPGSDAYGFQSYFGTSTLEIRSEASVSEFMRAKFPAGTPGGGGYPSAFRAGTGFSSTADQSRLYVRVRFRLSPNWTDNGNTGTKFFFFDQHAGNNHYVNLTEGGAFVPAVNLQSTFGFGTPSGPNHPLPNDLAKGVWHEMEVLIIGNTPGVYNGQLRVWVNGSLVVSDNVMGYFAAGQVARFNGLYFNPTYGGGFNPVPADQYLDLDHWYVSTAP